MTKTQQPQRPKIEPFSLKGGTQIRDGAVTHLGMGENWERSELYIVMMMMMKEMKKKVRKQSTTPYEWELMSLWRRHAFPGSCLFLLFWVNRRERNLREKEKKRKKIETEFFFKGLLSVGTLIPTCLCLCLLLLSLSFSFYFLPHVTLLFCRNYCSFFQ